MSTIIQIQAVMTNGIGVVLYALDDLGQVWYRELYTENSSWKSIAMNWTKE